MLDLSEKTPYYVLGRPMLKSLPPTGVAFAMAGLEKKQHKI